MDERGNSGKSAPQEIARTDRHTEVVDSELARRIAEAIADPETQPGGEIDYERMLRHQDFRIAELEAVVGDRDPWRFPPGPVRRQCHPDLERKLKEKASWNLRETMELTGFSDRHIRDLVKRGSLEAKGKGQGFRITSKSIHSWIFGARRKPEASGTNRK